MLRFFLLAALVSLSGALQAPVPQQSRLVRFASEAFATSLLTASLAFPSASSAASSTAAQISLDRLPPASIDVQIQDLPVVGKLVSGTYTKVPDGSIKNPSVTITSPKDILTAVKSIAGGHLEFDVTGFLKTHLDVDVVAEEPGVARIRVASPLIPRLPIRNVASAIPPGPGKSSPWKMVTDLGNGESYYFNEQTGVTQFDKPTALYAVPK